MYRHSGYLIFNHNPHCQIREFITLKIIFKLIIMGNNNNVPKSIFGFIMNPIIQQNSFAFFTHHRSIKYLNLSSRKNKFLNQNKICNSFQFVKKNEGLHKINERVFFAIYLPQQIQSCFIIFHLRNCLIGIRNGPDIQQHNAGKNGIVSFNVRAVLISFLLRTPNLYLYLCSFINNCTWAASHN